MTQPKYAPIERSDEVRPIVELETARPWVAHRPGEFRPGADNVGRGLGVPGPDQGYAWRLARHLSGRLQLEVGEHEDDVLAGAVAIALRRAAQFGRAPVLFDLELAASLFGFLGGAPGDLVVARRAMFSGLAHSYRARREFAQSIPSSTLALSPDAARHSLHEWRTLINTGSTAEGD